MGHVGPKETMVWGSPSGRENTDKVLIGVGMDSEEGGVVGKARQNDLTMNNLDTVSMVREKTWTSMEGD